MTSFRGRPSGKRAHLGRSRPPLDAPEHRLRDHDRRRAPAPRDRVRSDVVRHEPRARRLGERPDDHQGRVQQAARDQRLPDRLRAAPHPDAPDRRPDPHDRRAGPPLGPRPALPAGEHDRARAADRRQGHGVARGDAGRHRHGRGRGRPPHRGGDDPRAPPRLDDRRRAEDARGRDRARCPGQGRGEGRRDAGARRPQGRQDVRGDRQGRVHGHVQRPGRRHRLRGRERGARPGVRQARCSRPPRTRPRRSSRAPTGSSASAR